MDVAFELQPMARQFRQMRSLDAGNRALGCLDPRFDATDAFVERTHAGRQGRETGEQGRVLAGVSLECRELRA